MRNFQILSKRSTQRTAGVYEHSVEENVILFPFNNCLGKILFLFFILFSFQNKFTKNFIFLHFFVLEQVYKNFSNKKLRDIKITEETV